LPTKSNAIIFDQAPSFTTPRATVDDWEAGSHVFKDFQTDRRRVHGMDGIRVDSGDGFSHVTRHIFRGDWREESNGVGKTAGFCKPANAQSVLIVAYSQENQ